jgi:hypothetical protein
MKSIKKHFLSAIALGIFIFIAFGSEDENNTTEKQMTIEEQDQALIKSCKSLDGVVDATIKDHMLTIRAYISKKEGQKLSYEMLKEIRKNDLIINSVIVLDLDYNIVGKSE